MSKISTDKLLISSDFYSVQGKTKIMTPQEKIKYYISTLILEVIC